MVKNKFLISLFSLLLFTTGLPAKDYQVSMFGIKSDGVTLNTRSIQRAIDFISEQGGGRLIFYVGRYLTGSIELKSNVTIRIEEGAALIAVPSVYDFKGVDGHTALIYAEKQENIGIGGKGLIEGNGKAVRTSIDGQVQKGHLKEEASGYAPALIYMKDCENIQIEQLILQNSCRTAEVYVNCKKISLSDVTVDNSASDRKAVFISGCEDLKMSGCYFNTTVAPIESAGTSRNLTFVHCLSPEGKTVFIDK